MSQASDLAGGGGLLCYNRGCGQTFDPQNNPDEGCRYHPGAPFFHDAYKGWTCCDKKATDFTEFLNFPGCTQGQHSRVKPEEPANITGDVNNPLNKSDEPVLAHPPPIVQRMARPKAGELSSSIRLKPTSIAPGLLTVTSTANDKPGAKSSADTPIAVGEACKNGGCQKRYTDGPEDLETCQYHPGSPIFHEGLKFWSCCQRRTSDFTAFLNQVGCESGQHCWRKPTVGSEASVDCRFDWHQTATKVTVAIYAKKYDPRISFVEVGPIHLRAHVFFPAEDAAFDLDVELHGIVDVEQSCYSMMGTKIEIHLVKAEPGSWTNLDIPKRSDPLALANISDEPTLESNMEQVDALDLDDLDLTPNALKLSTEASNGRIRNDIV
ncbi:hypothetical protein TCAL_03854 [Tigriopus californicus]|uniref:CHORD domain-containing protein n=1 Tax=Tigriopus californicus TaxID=6832 RepID=A0A553PH95_TIGCA|nr:cysteine and histidine-rich domain-containing protein morgana-like [Tigriopus californicus]TRY77045.1 hypothetical protein TCAL_03854 [Tigriopus californicus]